MEEKEDLLVTANTKRHKHPPCTHTLPPSLPHHQETQLLCRRCTENGFGDGGEFQDLARYLSGLQTERSW